MVKKILILVCCSILTCATFAQDEINSNGLNTFYHKNGAVSSEGYMKNGKPEGYWKTYYETGILKSEGNRKNHLLDSTWRFYSEEGVLQKEIAYRENKRSGPTLTFTTEGFLLTKENFEADIKQGNSFSYFPEGTVRRQTPFEKGLRHGTGYEYGKDSRVVSIFVFENNYTKQRQEINRKDRNGKKTGKWIEFYDNGEISLEGYYRDGMRNGYFREYDRRGVMVSTTKWRDDKVVEDAEELVNLDIRKEYYNNAKVKSVGSFKDGMPEGVTRFYDQEGEISTSKIYSKGVLLGEGIVDEGGIRQGTWKEFYADGSLRAEGDYKDGQKIGEWIFYFQSGKVAQKGKYIAGERPHGDWVWYYENGSVRREETFYRGIEDGKLVEYSDSGSVLTQGDFAEGLRVGKWLIDVGDHREEGEYLDGERHGEWIHLYKNGKLNFKGTYVAGMADGKHTYFFDNGQKSLEGKYVSGMKEGEWKRYNEDGTVMIEILYKDGEEKRVNGVKVKNYQPTRKLERKSEKADKKALSESEDKNG